MDAFKKVLEDVFPSLLNAEEEPRILFANEDAYNDASNDDLSENGDFQYERDNFGQVVIYTGIFAWGDGSYRDQAEPEKTEEDNEPPTERNPEQTSIDIVVGQIIRGEVYLTPDGQVMSKRDDSSLDGIMDKLEAERKK